MNKVKIGVIGLGDISNWHISAISNLTEAKVVAICDINEESLKEKAAHYGIKRIYTDYHEMLIKGDIDAVIICTPTKFHVEMTIAAAEAGKHVLVQKPVARNLEECDEMIRACRKADVTLMPSLMHIWFPETIMAKKLIEEGAIGRITMAKHDNVHHKFVEDKSWWYGYPEISGGGCLMDIGYHGVYTLRWLVGDIQKVSAKIKTFTKAVRDIELKVEDAAVLWYEFRNKSIGTHTVSWCAAEHGTVYPRFESEVYGTEGTILLHSPLGKIAFISKIWDESTIKEKLSGFPIQVSRIKVKKGLWLSKDWLASPYENMLEANYEEPKKQGKDFESMLTAHESNIDYMHKHFIDCILNDTAPSPSFEDGGKKTLEVIIAAYESNNTNRPIPIPSG